MSSCGAHDVGDGVIVCLQWQDWAESEPITAPVATFYAGTAEPPAERLHAWDISMCRHVNPGEGPLYLRGKVLCRRVNRKLTAAEVAARGGRMEYCVHMPPSDDAPSLLEVPRTNADSPLALAGCHRHEPLDGMLCSECVHGKATDGSDARDFMLGLGYVCTIRVFGA
jgi:hypothetical protein